MIISMHFSLRRTAFARCFSTIFVIIWCLFFSGSPSVVAATSSQPVVMQPAASDEASVDDSPSDDEVVDADDSGDDILSEEEEVIFPATSTVDEARRGVMQVNSVYVDETGARHIITGGSGFLIGDPEETEYVITCNHIVQPDKELRDKAFAFYSIPKKESDDWDKIKLEVHVVAESDVIVTATIISSSEALDLAVLELSQPIYTKTPLTILAADTPAEERPFAVTDSVYALGFPYEINFEENPVYYSSDKVSMSSGRIVNLTTENNVALIQHDAAISTNNCGGPIINADGEVVGMNELLTDGNYYYSLDSSEITQILDALGLQYSKLTKSMRDERSAEEARLAAEAEAANNPAPLPEVPVKRGLPVFLISILIVLGLVLVAGIVFAVIYLIRRSKKKTDKKAAPVTPSAPTSAMSVSATSYPDNMETGVLGASTHGETTVLGGGAPRNAITPGGTLVRQKNGENIVIGKSFFTIGKDSLHVDYCIKDNSAISRRHCAIQVTSAGTMIKDSGSTNGTFLNQQRLSPEQAYPLKDGDEIMVADEVFIYKQ